MNGTEFHHYKEEINDGESCSRMFWTYSEDCVARKSLENTKKGLSVFGIAFASGILFAGIYGISCVVLHVYYPDGVERA